MSKKLKIYSTLFVVVLVYFVVTNVVHYDSYTWYQGGEDKLEFVENPAEFITRDTIIPGGVKTTYLPTVTYEVSVMPKNKDRALISTAKWSGPQKVEKQTYKVTMQKVKLEAPTSKKMVNFQLILFFVWAIVIAIVTIWILSMVFKLIRRIRQGEFFVAQVSKYLEITGYLLTALYLFQWISSYAFTKYCIDNIQLADYYIVYKNEANHMYIITGLALMIISQIILKGKELKEEQELTI